MSGIPVLQGGPFLLGFLHPVFAKHPVASLQHRADMFGVIGFADGDQRNIVTLAAGLLCWHAQWPTVTVLKFSSVRHDCRGYGHACRPIQGRLRAGTIRMNKLVIAMSTAPLVLERYNHRVAEPKWQALVDGQPLL